MPIGNLSGGDGGGVANPVTSTNNIADNAIVRGDGGARGVQGSVVTIDDSGVASGFEEINVADLTLEQNNITATGTNLGVTLVADGVGSHRLDADSVLQTRTEPGTTVFHRIYNVGTGDTASHAQFEARTASTGGDPFYSVIISGTRSYSWGIDNTDSDTFKIVTNTTISSPPSSGTELYSLTSAGDASYTSTGYLKLPTGTTGERPGSPVQGMIRGNTSNNNIDYYNGSAWRSISSIELIEYQDLTSVADVEFTDNITTNVTYKICCFRIVPVNNGDTLIMELSQDNGATWSTTNYEGGLNYSVYNSSSLNNINSTSNAPVIGPSANSASSNASFDMQIQSRGANTTFWFGQCEFEETTGGTSAFANFGGRTTNTGYNAIRFRFSSGNIANCRIGLYRYNT